MNAPEIRFELPFPAEYRAVVEGMIRHNAWLLPKWVEVIWVQFESAPPSAAISTRIRVNEEYRSLRMAICPEWLVSPENIRHSDIRHEFLHAQTYPLDSLAQRLVNMLEDGKLKDWADHELQLARERTTADLEYAINRGILI